MVTENVKKEVTITGFVAATEWDDNDNAIAIEIFTDDDNYRVDNNKQGEELFDFLDEEVEVTGFTREDRDGGKWISVTSYEVLDEEDDEEYDDYEEYGEYDEYDEDDEDDENDLEAEDKH
jgi:hypothetical protein